MLGEVLSGRRIQDVDYDKWAHDAGVLWEGIGANDVDPVDIFNSK